MSEINTENIITFLQQLMLWTTMCKSELATVKYDFGGFDFLIFIYEHARAIIPTEGVPDCSCSYYEEYRLNLHKSKQCSDCSNFILRKKLICYDFL